MSPALRTASREMQGRVVEDATGPDPELCTVLVTEKEDPRGPPGEDGLAASAVTGRSARAA